MGATSAAGTIAPHPCKERKDGAPSFEKVHTKPHTKVGHPSWINNLTIDNLTRDLPQLTSTE